ncbi:MAG: hypothetical protein AB7U85_05000 [Alphaproteobacteria bacterium]
MAKEKKETEENKVEKEEETKKESNSEKDESKKETKSTCSKEDPMKEIKEKAESLFNVFAGKAKEQVQKAQELAEKHQVKEKFVKGLVVLSSKLNEKALELEKKVNETKPSDEKAEEKGEDKK